jgi:hypothetical protein
MNGTTHNNFLMNRLMKWPVICGLSGLLLAQTVPAGQDFYINNSVVTNPGNLDATNFVNYNSFSSGTFLPYETTDTLNYTNYDTMTGFGGFVFDTLTLGSPGGRSMASSFYNPGSITVGSGVNLLVTATNLVSPGLLDVGANGGLFLTGQNVNLSYATLTMEQAPFSPPGTGNFGTDTNSDWDPSVALTATSAFSSEPNVFFASPSVAYSESDPVGTNDVIIRAIFLNNSNSNVTAQAYFGQAAFGNGAGNVEWTGVFTNPVTGLPLTNYLILNNDYLLGASTNLNLSSGYPNNFQFSTDPTSLAGLPPATVALPTYPPGVLTNVYSYANVQVVPTSVSPGVTSQNPSGALTNLPARFQISASREFSLALANVTGQNYLSLACTNQFDGSVGATIISPYSDINLGVTNGFLTVSNLLQSVIPAWSGTIQAWSTVFLNANTNSGSTITNDFRVLIVQSSLTPFTSPQIQDLKLHSTNLVISDVLNVIRNLSIDASSMTLTTNSGYPNSGAGSPDGELNLSSGATLFATALPNLLWLTNNGKITIANAGNFGGPSPANYQVFINNGLLSDQGSTIYASVFQNAGTIANGSGNFFLQSQSTVLTNGSITAVGDIAITANSLVAGMVQIQAGRSLTLEVTNLLTDDGAANTWSVGASSLNGLNLPILPTVGDLTNTTIYVLASANKNVVNTWAGADRGANGAGYLNDASLDGLILDARSTPPHSLFTFNGTGANNAMYVVNLYLTNTAATLNFATSTATALAISPGMTIYYQNAYSNGVPVSSTINNWNNGQLRWVSPANLSAVSTIVMVQPTDPPASFNFKISGVQLFSGGLATGATYPVIIQATSNLLSPKWVNVYTGTPPFTFNDFGFTTNKQQYYRAKQGW